MQSSSRAMEEAAGLGLLGLGAVTLGLAAWALTPHRLLPDRALVVGRGDRDTALMLRAAQQLNRGSGLLAFSVLADSAVEHYRGHFHNPSMLAPLLSASAGLIASLHGLREEEPGLHRMRGAAQAASAAVGVVGTAFHLYNVVKRPGGVCWHNLFYAAPIGAPMALSLSGMLGVLAERVRIDAPGPGLRIFGWSAGRMLSFAASFGLLATSAEAGLMHFRGAFHNPAMLLPVTLPPVAATVLAQAALGPTRQHRRWSRLWMRLTGGLGVLGSALHAVGVGRNMGGWANWRQNVLAGPPLPAPPSFSALTLAGIAAMELLEEEQRRG